MEKTIQEVIEELNEMPEEIGFLWMRDYVAKVHSKMARVVNDRGIQGQVAFITEHMFNGSEEDAAKFLSKTIEERTFVFGA